MEITVSPGLLLARGSERVREDASADVEFAGLVERQARVMFKVAMSVVRNEADAEDAVQEAFLKLYRTGAWRGAREERAFAGRVVWRCALDRLPGGAAGGTSGQARTERMEREDGSEVEIASGAESVEERMSGEGERARLRVLIQGLPEDLRGPLVLSAIEEMTSAEVAVVLGIPEGTVRTRVMRAKAELRKRFEAGAGRRAR